MKPFSSKHVVRRRCLRAVTAAPVAGPRLQRRHTRRGRLTACLGRLKEQERVRAAVVGVQQEVCSTMCMFLMCTSLPVVMVSLLSLEWLLLHPMVACNSHGRPTNVLETLQVRVPTVLPLSHNLLIMCMGVTDVRIKLLMVTWLQQHLMVVHKARL